MKLNIQKELASKILGASTKRIKIDLQRLEELGISIDDFKQSITKQDIRGYINKRVIYVVQKKGISRGRAKLRHEQKMRGRHRGMGSRKGTAKARLPKKETWMKKIRNQRELIQTLREKKVITNEDFWNLYRKAKGGFFRSRRHVKLFIEEHDMIKQTKQEAKKN
jgi:large subunit ribosomal protein L19e